MSVKSAMLFVMTVSNVHCRLFTSCHGSQRCPLYTLYPMPYLLLVSAAAPLPYDMTVSGVHCRSLHLVSWQSSMSFADPLPKSVVVISVLCRCFTIWQLMLGYVFVSELHVCRCHAFKGQRECLLWLVVTATLLSFLSVHTNEKTVKVFSVWSRTESMNNYSVMFRTGVIL